MLNDNDNFKRRLNKYVKMYPEEFLINPNNELFCNLCSCLVNTERKSSVDKHRTSKKQAKNTVRECSERAKESAMGAWWPRGNARRRQPRRTQVASGLG